VAVQATVRGEDVALARSNLVADDIAAGGLEAPFPDLRLKAERGHDLTRFRHYRRRHAASPARPASIRAALGGSGTALIVITVAGWS
jgi:hypothetical protein